jgi:ribosomal protein S18 acetylase RimI-like enzyme
VSDAARNLMDLCNRHEGLDLPLNLEPTGAGPEGRTSQFFFHEAGSLLGVLTLDGEMHPEVCLAVHPDHRRKGIGRALLVAGLEECRRGGSPEALLVCEERSASGNAFVNAIGAVYRYSEFRMVLDGYAWPGPSHAPDSAGALLLRPAGVEDADLLAHIIATSFQKPVEGEHRRVARDLASPRHRLFVAFAGGNPVGSVGVVTAGGRTYIIALGVLPQHRGRGYGRRMLEAITADLLAAGCSEIFIEVAVENRSALFLYRSCGFRDITSYGFYAMATS